MSMLKEFKEFAMRGNVVDLAVGVVIGAAFGKIVTSLVGDVIMPPIGKVTGGVDFKDLYITLDHAKMEAFKAAPHANIANFDAAHITMQQAKDAGIAVIAYGAFLNDVITFLIVALVVFLVIKAFNKMKREKPAEAASKDCPYCLSSIPVAATRCSGCTSELKAA